MARLSVSFRLLSAMGLFYLLLSSCAVFEKGPSPVKTVSPVTPPAAKKPAAPPAMYDPGPVIREATGSMEKGLYEKAVEEYKSALSLHPGNGLLLSGCRKALLAANGVAETSFVRGDFGRAGSLYYLVADNYRLAQPWAVKPAYLEKRIGDCGAALTKRGLESYRKGKLHEAISRWEEVLRFEPGNSEVKKAVETARTQLKDLSK